MKKLIIILVLFSVAFIASAQDYTITKPGVVTQILSADTLTSAGADTVDLYIKTVNGKPLNYALQVVSANVSGTSEGYVDLYKSNYVTGGWELIATRSANDTLTSSNLIGWRNDTDGYEAPYLRLIITNKTQTQSTIYNAFIYPTLDFE